MADFFSQYFVEPILQGSGYNIYNTTVYAILFVIAAVITYKMLQKLKIKIDSRFFFGIIPFVMLGGILRSLEDYNQSIGIEKNFLLITPLIYVSIFVIALVSLLFAVFLERKKKIPYNKTWFFIGLVIAVWGLVQMKFNDLNALSLMVGIFAGWVIAVLVAKQIAKRYFPKMNSFLSKENMFLILVHLFDATTTYVAIEFYPYFEQHVVTGFFITTLGTASVFLLKLVVVTAVLYVFDKELKDDTQKRTFLKILVMILGMGPGLRNFLRLVMGV